MHWRRIMAIHSRILAMRFWGTEEPGGLLSMGSHRVGQDWNDSSSSIVIKKSKHNFQFSSVAQSCLTLCDPMKCSMPGFSVHLQLLELAQAQVHQVGNVVQPSCPLSSTSPSAFNLFRHQDLFQWVCSFASGGQSIGPSASASILPMNSQGWFPLGLTGLIFLQSRGLSRAFSSTMWTT